MLAHMSTGDFYGSEKAALIDAAGSVKIELIAQDGTATVLKEKTTVQAGEILDCAVMSKNALRDFIAAEIEDAKQKGVLLSVHLKATMMKVSDPIACSARSLPSSIKTPWPSTHKCWSRSAST